MEGTTKHYELAYLLTPSVPEEEVLTHAGKLSAMIEADNGTIRHLETPKKRKLAYAVKKEKTAYFGWTTFGMAPAGIAGLGKKIREMPAVFRHMIVEEEVETRRPFLRPFAPRSTGSFAQKAIMREQQKPEQKLDLETLDKKLEEILGK